MAKPFQEPLRVIRRVQAVIEVPVKEESDEDVEGLLSGADSEYDSRMHEKGPSGKTPQKAKVKRRSSVKSRRTVPSDDDEDYEEPPIRRRTQADADSEDELAIGAEVRLLYLMFVASTDKPRSLGRTTENCIALTVSLSPLKRTRHNDSGPRPQQVALPPLRRNES